MSGFSDFGEFAESNFGFAPASEVSYWFYVKHLFSSEFLIFYGFTTYITYLFSP